MVKRAKSEGAVCRKPRIVKLKDEVNELRHRTGMPPKNELGSEEKG